MAYDHMIILHKILPLVRKDSYIDNELWGHKNES
jgi:hypothetical protein